MAAASANSRAGMDRVRRQLLLVGQIDLIGPNFLAAEQVRRLAEVSCKQRYLPQLQELGIERKIAHLHILAHAWRSGVMMSSSVDGTAENSRRILAQLELLLNT